MGKIPVIRRILAENFKDLSWMPRLASPINIFMEQTIRLFNKNLNFNDNIDGELKEFTASGTYPVNISWNRPNKPVAVWIGRVLRTDGSTVSYSAALSLKWQFNTKGEIQIDDVVGLDDSASVQYKLVIIGVTG